MTTYRHTDVLNILEGCTLIADCNEGQLYRISNFFASCFWAGGTKWCIDRPEHYEYYLRAGPLYLVKLRRKPAPYLMSVEQREFRNWRNRRLCFKSFRAKYPFLAAHLAIRIEKNIAASFFFDTVPENTVFDQTIYLRDCGIRTLPDGLHIRGSLNLEGCPIAQLPRRLQVGDTLHIGRTNIRALPDDLVVGGRIDAGGQLCAAIL